MHAGEGDVHPGASPPPVNGYWRDVGLDDSYLNQEWKRPPPDARHFQVPSTATSLGAESYPESYSELWDLSPQLRETCSTQLPSSEWSAGMWTATPTSGPTTSGLSMEMVLGAAMEERAEESLREEEAESVPSSSPSTLRGWSELRMALGGMDAAVKALAVEGVPLAVLAGTAVDATEEESTDEVPNSSSVDAAGVMVAHDKSQDSFGGLSPIKMSGPDAPPDVSMTQEAFADSTDDAVLDASAASAGRLAAGGVAKAEPLVDGAESTDSGEVTLEESQLLSATRRSVAWAADRGLVPERGVSDLYQYF